MAALVEAFRALKLWQVALLSAVLLAAGGGTYAGYSLVSGSGSDQLDKNQQLIPVRAGDLVNQVTVNGSVLFPNREALTFGSQGTVDAVLVAEGDRVAKGQPLARLDAATTANLAKAVAQARLTVRTAEDALAKALNPHTALDLAKSEAAVANAKLALKSSEDSLARLLQPTAQDVAQAGSAVAGARLALKAQEDALARLVKPTAQDVAQAESAVAGAKLALKAQEDALAKLVKPTAQDVAQAEAAVAGAKLALKTQEDALAKLVKPTAQDVAQAEAAVAGAKLALKTQEDALAKLVKPTAQDVAQAESAVANASLTLKNLTDALDLAKAGPAQADVAKAQLAVDVAGTALDGARADLLLARKEWDAKTKTAQDAFDGNLASYKQVFRKWLGIELSPEEVKLDPATLLKSWGADLSALFDAGLRLQSIGASYLSAWGAPDDPATRWNEVTVFLWLNFIPFRLLPTCENTLVGPQTVCVGKELDDAWNARQSADDNLETVQTQAAKALANAETAVRRSEDSLAGAGDALAKLNEGVALVEVEAKEKQVAVARASLAKAQEDLAKLVGKPDPVDVDAKEKQVAVARASLAKAEEDLAKLIGKPDPADVDAKEKQVEVARANRAKAEDDLAKLIGKPDPADVDAKEKQVEVARSTLDEAGESLRELKASVDPLEVALRESEVAAAKAALEAATDRLDGSTLKAPMDGIVAAVNVEPGQLVNASAAAIEVVDPKVVELDGTVDEIDVLYVQQGARATVTMDALAGQTLSGTVSSIAAAARSQQGVVSYPLRIRVEAPAGVDLREGLTATARIVLREELDVLLIPQQAVHGTFDQPFVRVMKKGRVEEQPVVLGNSDDFWVVARQGLVAGDSVVMETAQAVTTQFGFGPGAGAFGAGAFVGGGRGGPITIDRGRGPGGPGGGGGGRRR